MPEGLGIQANGSLAACPGTPNCVHTGMRHPEGTAPIYLREDVPAAELLDRVEAVVAGMPRTVIVSRAERYIHAEATSRIFRFVDDLELLVAGGNELVVRSASRVGRSDLGVNRRRVAALREGLRRAGLLRS